MQACYFIGMDLGQTSDPSAVAVLERAADAYLLRHLQRFPLGTPYTTIVPSVIQLCRSVAALGPVSLVIDQTGVGRPVVDMIRQHPQAPWTVPITITGGRKVTADRDGSLHVPKKDLVTSLQLLFENRRLRIAKGLPDTAVFIRELLNFRVAITPAATETFGAWRDGEHDDLVLAVALVSWLAERESGNHEFAVDDTPSIIESAPEGVFLT
jgi:hypothetical protein